MSETIFALEKYSIIEKLATGGMADIYLALLKNRQFQNKFCVIKKIIPSLAERTDYLAYLKDEAKALSLLDHENIVSFQDYFYEGDQFYLVTEFINGKTLREICSDFDQSKIGFKIVEILHIITEVAAGLDFAHRSIDALLNKPLNLVHRDINPENIMISYEGKVKIIDFGISKFDIRDDFTKTGMMKGKFSYMSPEQAEGGMVDSRTDIFALGIIAWELMSGKRLFDGNDDYEKISKIKDNKVGSIREMNPECPVEVEQIIMKALAAKVEDRYQAASEFRYALQKIIFSNYPEFRPENFKKKMSDAYSAENKSRIEKLKAFLLPEVETNQETKIITSETNTSSTIELPRFPDEKETDHHRVRQEELIRERRGIPVPESFETKINYVKPEILVQTETKTSKKQRNKIKGKYTSQNPEKYKVQTTMIQTSFEHDYFNKRVFKNFFLSVLLVAGCFICFMIYREGYLKTAFNFAVPYIMPYTEKIKLMIFNLSANR